MKLIRVTKVQHVGGHKLSLEFSDGTSGVADLSGELDAELMAPLRDEAAFARAFVDIGTVCWPGDLDLAPERLYALAHGMKPPTTIAEVEANELEMGLRALRKSLGITQQQLAEALDMTQSQVSRFSMRDDLLISTLRRVVQALGGEVELVATVGNKQVKLSV